MFITKKPCSNLIRFDETFHAKMSRRFATLFAFHHRHIIAGHQCNGVLRCGISPARANNVNLCLGRRPKVIKMDHVRLFGKDIVSLTRFTHFMSAPTTDSELTQMPATFQPDGAQVRIQFFKRDRPSHFKVKPEVFIISCLDTYMPKGFFWLITSACGLNNLFPLFALCKVTGHTAFCGFLTTVLTLSA
jgi:hypothetical protein